MTPRPPRNVAVLGATGSIGRSAAAVIAASPERFRLYAAAARDNVAGLRSQVEALHPEVVVLTDVQAARRAGGEMPSTVEMRAGEAALEEIATLPEVDTVLCAVVGIAGVRAVISALRAGKRVALASKEVLVMAGDIVMAAGPGEVIPVDSEHSGVFQCLSGRRPEEISRVILTASGGPFRDWPAERIARATPADAVNHPVWSMGIKVSIDSASLMNKALELIEARYLFHLTPEQIAAVIHPQSVVHALAELCDGSVMAQLSRPDMKLAIQYALSYPERLPLRPAGTLDLASLGRLDFQVPDEARFPSLALAREAMRRGGAAPAVLNAANDAAVELFKAGKITFNRIWDLVERALNRCGNFDDGTLESRFAADAEARKFVGEQVLRGQTGVAI